MPDKPKVQRLHSIGVQRISDERMRQILQEGFTAEHDDTHAEGELMAAATCYMMAYQRGIEGANAQDLRELILDLEWPWDPHWWKPSPNPIRNLEISGALVAAEIDRLLRLKEKEM